MSDSVISHDSESPAHGQQVITACAFIHHNFDGVEKVFLPRRAATKKFLPNVWELPGGHIDYGEDLVAGLKREAQEEFEKDITVGDVAGVFTYVNDIKGSHSIEVVYFAQFVGGIDDIRLHPEDHSACKWFSEADLAELPQDDDETILMHRAFALLRGEPLQT